MSPLVATFLTKSPNYCERQSLFNTAKNHKLILRQHKSRREITKQ